MAKNAIATATEIIERQAYKPVEGNIMPWPFRLARLATEVTEGKELYSSEYDRKLVVKDGLLLIPMERSDIQAMLQKKSHDSDFRGMDLSAGVDLFKGGDFRNGQFQGAYAPGVDFSNADISYAGFEGSYMPGARFQVKEGAHARFDESHLEGAFFEGNFKNAFFRWCNLNGASFEGNFEWVSFEGGALKKARFNINSAYGIDLAGADMTSSEFSNINAVYMRCHGTFWDNANVEGSAFADFPFMKTMLEGWCKGTPVYEQIEFMDIARLFPRGDGDLMLKFKKRWDREHT